MLNIDSKQRYQLYLSVVVGSLIIAAWSRFIDPVINRDGTIYILSAIDFKNGNFAQALDAYKWPFYPVSIALFSKLSSLDAETAAVLFNAIMRALGGIAFVRICHRLGADSFQLWLAVLVYLFFPGLNEVQSMIVKDHAYLSCFLWMVLYLIQYKMYSQQRDLVLFILMGMLASAYRIEGFAYLAIASLAILLSDNQKPQQRRIGILALVIILPLLFWGATYWNYGGIQGAWAGFQGLISRSGSELTQYIHNLESGWTQTVMQKTYYPILISTPFTKGFVNFVDVLSLGYALIFLFGLRKWKQIKASAKLNAAAFGQWKIVVWINLLVLALFAVIHLIFTDRYPLSLSLMVVALLPFVLSFLFRSPNAVNSKREKGVCIFIILLLFVNAIEGLDRITSKHHLLEAGQWINRQMGEELQRQSVYSNDIIVDYYAGQTEVKDGAYYTQETTDALVMSTRWEELDFMAIRLNNKRNPDLYRNFTLRFGKDPAKIFKNRKGDKVLVYDFR